MIVMTETRTYIRSVRLRLEKTMNLYTEIQRQYGPTSLTELNQGRQTTLGAFMLTVHGGGWDCDCGVAGRIFPADHRAAFVQTSY